MTKEEALAVIQRIADAWNAFGQSLAEVAQALEEMIHGLGASDELWPKRNGMLPKKYGMALQRRIEVALQLWGALGSRVRTVRRLT